MNQQSANIPTKKYSKLITLVSILIPVIVAILFTIRLPNVAPLDFLPPIYAAINAVTAIILIAAYIAIRKKKNKTTRVANENGYCLILGFSSYVCSLSHDL